MKENPKLFSYIVARDTGLAPNPFWGKLTLAVCKPQIRSSAREGDIIVGLTPRPLGYGLVYAAVVSETLSFSEYFQDIRFQKKKPQMTSPDQKNRAGDNFYMPTEEGYTQLWSLHSNADGTENKEKKVRDLSGKYVLIGNEYYYYGNASLILPDNLSFLQVGRGHRCTFTTDQLIKFSRYVDTLIPGLWGNPRNIL